MPGVFCAPIAHHNSGKVPAYLLSYADLATFNGTYTTYQDQLLRLISSSSEIVVLQDPPDSLTATSAQNYYAPPNSFLFGKDAAIDHWHNGLPYTADGAIAVEAADVVFYHNGVPFTAAGKVAIEGEAPPFEDPTHNPGLMLWLDASDTGTYDNVGGYATYFNDKSGNNLNFTGLGTASRGGRILTTIVPGMSILRFGGDGISLSVADPMGSDDTAATWSFLHDGTQAQIYMVVVPYADFSGTMMGTGTGATSTDIGFLLNHEYIGYLQGDCIHEVGNGSSLVASNTITDAFIPLGADTGLHISMIYAELDLSNGTAANRNKIAMDGGSLVGNNTDTGTVSASAPTGTLVIGADAGGVNAGTYAFCELVIVVGAPSATDRTNMETYLTNKWGPFG